MGAGVGLACERTIDFKLDGKQRVQLAPATVGRGADRDAGALGGLPASAAHLRQAQALI